MMPRPKLKPEAKKKPVQFKLSPQHIAYIDAMAAEKGLNKTQFIELLLNQAINENRFLLGQEVFIYGRDKGTIVKPENPNMPNGNGNYWVYVDSRGFASQYNEANIKEEAE